MTATNDWGWAGERERREFSSLSHDFPGHEERMRNHTARIARLGLSGEEWHAQSRRQVSFERRSRKKPRNRRAA